MIFKNSWYLIEKIASVPAKPDNPRGMRIKGLGSRWTSKKRIILLPNSLVFLSNHSPRFLPGTEQQSCAASFFPCLFAILKIIKMEITNMIPKIKQTVV